MKVLFGGKKVRKCGVVSQKKKNKNTHGAEARAAGQKGSMVGGAL